tara:strand:- start:289 stop:411 length:123 start_codon:yes stop_codon:yes gene_type:complete
MDKNLEAYKTIGEVVEILNLNSKQKKINNYSLNKILGEKI